MTTAHDSGDVTTNLHVDVQVRPLEFAAAQDAAAWARSRFVYVARTALGVLFLAAVALSVLQPGETAIGSATVSMFTGLALLPWTFFRLTSWLTPLRPYTLDALTSHGMLIRTDGAVETLQFDDFPIRVETKTLFVLASRERPGVVAIPKRVFRSEATLEAFRDLMGTSPRPAAVVRAVHVFGDEASEDAVTFTLTPREALRARRLMMGRRGYVVFGVTLAAVTLYIAYQVAKLGFALGVGVGVVFALVVTLAISIGFMRGARRMLPVTVDFDEDTVRAASGPATVRFRWDAVTRLEDDDLLFVLVTTTSRVAIPKRVLADAAIDGIRSRCVVSGR